MSTLLKDLRRRLTGDEPAWMQWKIDPANYTIADIAARVREFLYVEHYSTVYAGAAAMPELGAYIAGYSSGEVLGEVHELKILSDGTCNAPAMISVANEPGIWVGGQIDVLFRLIAGFAPQLPILLQQQLGNSDAERDQLMNAIAPGLQLDMICSPMPIQDAIDLAEFLADVAVKVSRFTPGAATVGGPIESAAITKHEGYKWIKRKYYYDREVNPEEPYAQ